MKINDISKMTKAQLINAALRCKFDRDTLPALAEVVAATTNPDVATLILIGEYKEPTFNEFVFFSYYKEIRRFVSFDKWTDEVIYTEIRESTKGHWFKKGTKESSITMDNFDTLKEKSDASKDQEFISIKTGKRELKEGYTSSESWIEESKHLIDQNKLKSWIEELRVLLQDKALESEV